MTLDFEQTPEFIRGREGEDHIERLLLADGYYLLSTRDFKTARHCAPRLRGCRGDITCPDTLATKYGHALWIDAKTKDHPNVFRKFNREEHGIDARHGNAYLAVEQETAWPVWLAVYEETRNGQPSQVILCGRLRELMRHVRKSEPSYNYAPMWNFLREDFMEVGPREFDRAFFP